MPAHRPETTARPPRPGAGAALPRRAWRGRTGVHLGSQGRRRAGTVLVGAATRSPPRLVRHLRRRQHLLRHVRPWLPHRHRLGALRLGPGHRRLVPGAGLRLRPRRPARRDHEDLPRCARLRLLRGPPPGLLGPDLRVGSRRRGGGRQALLRRARLAATAAGDERRRPERLRRSTRRPSPRRSAAASPSSASRCPAGRRASPPRPR